MWFREYGFEKATILRRFWMKMITTVVSTTKYGAPNYFLVLIQIVLISYIACSTDSVGHIAIT